MRLHHAILMCLIATTANAETLYRFGDGKLYRNTPNGPQVVDIKIVDLTNGEPIPPDDPTPTDDKFGLAKVSKDALASVPDYRLKENARERLAAFYTALASAVEDGTIPRDKLAVAVDTTFRQAVGIHADKWQSWRDKTSIAFKQAPINSAADAAQGLRDLGSGLMDETTAIDWEKLITFFIEVILPLIIKLIGEV